MKAGSDARFGRDSTADPTLYNRENAAAHTPRSAGAEPAPPAGRARHPFFAQYARKRVIFRLCFVMLQFSNKAGQVLEMRKTGCYNRFTG